MRCRNGLRIVILSGFPQGVKQSGRAGFSPAKCAFAGVVAMSADRLTPSLWRMWQRCDGVVRGSRAVAHTLRALTLPARRAHGSEAW